MKWRSMKERPAIHQPIVAKCGTHILAGRADTLGDEFTLNGVSITDGCAVYMMFQHLAAWAPAEELLEILVKEGLADETR